MALSKPENFQYIWNTIHAFAAAAKTPEKRKEYKRFVETTIPLLLPCDACSLHFAQNIKRYDINLYMGSEEQLLLWSYLIHGVVNEMLDKKQQPSYNEVKRKYLPEPGMTCTTVCSADSEEQEHKSTPTKQKKLLRGSPSFRYK